MPTRSNWCGCGFLFTPIQFYDKINPIINNTYRPRFLEGLGGKKEHFKQKNGGKSAFDPY
jgi:hypothetical protein